MKKHFVEFYRPGTFVASGALKEIDSWDVDAAVAMARGMTNEHGAWPYGFRFLTRERGEDDLDSKVTEESGMYYLGGKVETLEDVEARATDDDKILISNMKGNGWDRIITNCNSWKWTQPLNEDDTVLDV